jgi:hypothetical protein
MGSSSSSCAPIDLREDWIEWIHPHKSNSTTISCGICQFPPPPEDVTDGIKSNEKEKKREKGKDKIQVDRKNVVEFHSSITINANCFSCLGPVPHWQISTNCHWQSLTRVLRYNNNNNWDISLFYLSISRQSIRHSLEN